MARPTIITFSGAAGSGKDAAAEIFHELAGLKFVNNAPSLSCLIIRYADYLKFIATSYLGWDGVKDEAGRTLLQELGTEIVRSKYPDFWIQRVMDIVKLIGDNYKYILIPDARFSNEITSWELLGYDVVAVNIIRDNYDNGLTDEQKAHASENSLVGFDFDVTLRAETLGELIDKVAYELFPVVLCRS